MRGVLPSGLPSSTTVEDGMLLMFRAEEPLAAGEELGAAVAAGLGAEAGLDAGAGAVAGALVWPPLDGVDEELSSSSLSRSITSFCS